MHTMVNKTTESEIERGWLMRPINPAAAINSGTAECQRLSRCLSECHPLTCIAMQVTRYGKAPSSIAGIPSRKNRANLPRQATCDSESSQRTASKNERQRNGAHEITGRFGAVLPNEPVAQIDNHPREETGFRCA